LNGKLRSGTARFAVTLRNLDLTLDLWAQVEVKFEIQVEDGLLWMIPEVQVQTPQWTLYAL
jgi:hypothetical protein